MDAYLQLLEDVATLHNRAQALGVNLTTFTDEASRTINAALDENFKHEIAEIKNGFRRPSSGSVN